MKNLSPRVQARQPCSVGKVTLWVTVTRSLNLSAHSKEQMAEHQAVYATDEVDSRVVLRYLLILCCSMVVHSLSSGSRPKRPAHMVLKRSRSALSFFVVCAYKHPLVAHLGRKDSRQYCPHISWTQRLLLSLSMQNRAPLIYFRS